MTPLFRWVIIALLDFWWRLSNKKFEASERLVLLRGLLRRFPYWKQGHLAFGALNLDNKHYGESYASAYAVLSLSKVQQDPAAHWLLARVFLAKGELNSAIQNFEKSWSLLKPDPLLAEDFAAALIAGGNSLEAYNVLSLVENGKLTPGGVAALNLVRQRTNG